MKRLAAVFLCLCLLGMGGLLGFAQATVVSEPSLTKDAEGYYLISNYEELKAFAALVNPVDGGQTNINAKLTADITASDKAWTPIGTFSKKFEGVFDGQGYIITGLSNENNIDHL